MHIKLGDNIRAMRKMRGLTQEQLAEAFGVTVGAVSKWESGLTTPELSLIVEMAEFFETSVDVLLGYEWHRNGPDETASRLRQFRKEKNLADGLPAAEKALQKFPNHFEVVYQSAMLYFVNLDVKTCQRAIQLFQRACELLEQNTDPIIGRSTLQNRVAACYLMQNKIDEAVELLKQNNMDGRNDDLIGFILAGHCGKAEEALPYLSDALARCTSTLLHICMGYANAFVRKGEYRQGMEILQWLLSVDAGLKIPGKTSYLDKTDALVLAACAAIAAMKGEEKEARDYLRQAREMALRFDADPEYQLSGIKFYKGAQWTTYDDIGETALEGILNMMQDDDNAALLLPLWRQLERESEHQPTVEQKNQPKGSAKTNGCL